MKMIILCGFMGCGKTTVGKQLARLYGYTFIDLDSRIESKAGKSIPEIFEAEGESGFRDREYQSILELAGGQDMVLALGGGAVTYPRNLEALRRMGTIVYLECPFSVCYARIRHSQNRPLVREGEEKLRRRFDERHPIYAGSADVIVNADGDAERISRAVYDIVKMQQTV